MSILGKRAARPHDTTALIAGIAAFTTWGLIPGYWKLLNGVSPPEILAHRFVWTSLFLIGLLSWQKRWPEVNATTSSRRATLFCLAAGVAVATNWFFFIFAVTTNLVRMLQHIIPEIASFRALPYAFFDLVGRIFVIESRFVTLRIRHTFCHRLVSATCRSECSQFDCYVQVLPRNASLSSQGIARPSSSLRRCASR